MPRSQPPPEEQPKQQQQQQQRKRDELTRAEREQALKAANEAGDDDGFGENNNIPPLFAAFLKMITPSEKRPPVETNVDAASVRGLLTLIGVLKGQFEQHNHVTRVSHTDGVPRGWRRLRGLESFAEDAHPVDAAAWLQSDWEGAARRTGDVGDSDGEGDLRNRDRDIFTPTAAWLLGYALYTETGLLAG